MREQFENVFKKKNVPDEVPEFNLTSEMPILDIMISGSLAPSKKEARRLLDQGAVSIVDGDKITESTLSLDSSFDQRILKVGKRKFLKLVFS
jgi:tyrosyl-tRNA synthetase